MKELDTQIVQLTRDLSEIDRLLMRNYQALEEAVSSRLKEQYANQIKIYAKQYERKFELVKLLTEYAVANSKPEEVLMYAKNDKQNRYDWKASPYDKY